MMPQKTMATLTAIFSEVLGNLAFMSIEDDLPDTPPGEIWLETTISYHGSANGTIRFHCSREFSALLAANLLGIELLDEGAESQAEDATKEFINVLCGQLVTTLHGQEEVFDLSIPQIQELPETPEFSQDNDNQVSAICVEGHVVQLLYTQND